MSGSETIREFLDSRNVFAVVGASRYPEKYGSRVYSDLKAAGYRVYPVNPKANRISGDKCYPDLKSLPEKPDVVSMAAPPEVTEKIVRECIKLGIKRIWMQPGSESKEAIESCRQNKIKILCDVCVMVKRKDMGCFDAL